MIERLKEYKWMALIGAALIGMGCFYFFGGMKETDGIADGDWTSGEELLIDEEKESSPSGEEVETEIIVDVKGAVKHPGVYPAEQGERVIDVIERAGGFKSSADKDAVNLAQRVEDQMVLYIPKNGEIKEEGNITLDIPSRGTFAGGTSSGGVSDGGKVNLNKATSSDLETLPGIGPAKAQAILDYREQNGPFQTIEDLMSVSGIGEKTFEKLKAHIRVK